MRCEADTQKGERCKAPALKGGRFCYHHDPEVAAERQEARRRGGLSLHYGKGGPDRPDAEIRVVRDVLALLETGAADILARPPSVERARALVYLSGAALKALEVGALEERVAALEKRLEMRSVS